MTCSWVRWSPPCGRTCGHSTWSCESGAMNSSACASDWTQPQSPRGWTQSTPPSPPASTQVRSRSASPSSKSQTPPTASSDARTTTCTCNANTTAPGPRNHAPCGQQPGHRKPHPRWTGLNNARQTPRVDTHAGGGRQPLRPGSTSRSELRAVRHGAVGVGRTCAAGYRYSGTRQQPLEVRVESGAGLAGRPGAGAQQTAPGLAAAAR